MNDFIIFLIAGGVLMTVPVFMIAFFQGGFFGKWLKAKTGRGKYVLIKVRSVLRDYFMVGEIKEEYLIYGSKEEKRRILIKDKSAIYKSFGVSCIDIDEATGGIANADFEALEGFDPDKQESLLVRALFRPSLEENQDKKILVLVLVACALAGLAALLSFMALQEIGSINQQVAGTIQSTIQSVV